MHAYRSISKILHTHREKRFMWVLTFTDKSEI